VRYARGVGCQPTPCSRRRPRSGRRHEGERAYRRAVSLDPNNATIRQWFAELLIALGRVDDAIIQIEAAIQVDPQSAINHAVASNHYRIAGRHEEALRMGERALALDPTMPAVWEFYSRTLFDLLPYKFLRVRRRRTLRFRCTIR